MESQGTKKTSTRLAAAEPGNQQKIAAVAYEFWLARAFHDGSPAEDWLRADRKVRGRVGTVRIRRTPLGNFLVS
jgi:hypothetical protein